MRKGLQTYVTLHNLSIALMKKVSVAFLVVTFCATLAITQGTPEHTVTMIQAKALVVASLSATQQQLPGLGAERYDDPNNAMFLFFTVTWKGTPAGSVVVGNYAVDPHTGDVFSASASCYELKNQKLHALQVQVRESLHLSQVQYKRLKTKGPLC